MREQRQLAVGKAPVPQQRSGTKTAPIINSAIKVRRNYQACCLELNKNCHRSLPKRIICKSFQIRVVQLFTLVENIQNTLKSSTMGTPVKPKASDEYSPFISSPKVGDGTPLRSFNAAVRSISGLSLPTPVDRIKHALVHSRNELVMLFSR